MDNEFENIVPKIRFSDRMKLQLEDMTLDLIYYSKNRSKSDILVYIPEEKVLISGGTNIPDLSSTHHKGDRERNIAHWISILKFLKEKINIIETVIPGHGELPGKESAKLYYEYFSEMYN